MKILLALFLMMTAASAQPAPPVQPPPMTPGQLMVKKHMDEINELIKRTKEKTLREHPELKEEVK